MNTALATQLPKTRTEELDVIVIGGGQAGLSVGYHLLQRGLRFVILDANQRVGDSWRKRWHSLRLFTPARFDGLAGMPFPAPADEFPTHHQMADYLEAYAAHFELPLEHGVEVERVEPSADGFRVHTAQRRYRARQVVIAMSNYQRAKQPAFARELSADVQQLHSSAYEGPHQITGQRVLVVGAGNSGAEIALELARVGRSVWLAGRDPGQVPFRIETWLARWVLVRLVLRVLFHRIFTISTPIGRKLRPKMLHSGAPRVRVKASDLARAGVVRVPRVVGAHGRTAELEDGSALKFDTIVFCTGYEPGFSFLDASLCDAGGEPRHRGGVAEATGLYFVGLHFLYSMSSGMIHGVGRDAERIVKLLSRRIGALRPTAGSTN